MVIQKACNNDTRTYDSFFHYIISWLITNNFLQGKSYDWYKRIHNLLYYY